MKIQDLIKKMKDGKVDFYGNCVDCGRHIKITANISGESLNIESGAIFCPPAHWNHPEMYMHKCQKCFDADPKFYPAVGCCH